MLLNPSQFSQQGLIPQFPGLQATGPSPFGPSLFGQPGFGQPGSYGANGQAPYPYGAQQSVFAGAANPFTLSPLLQNPSLYGAFQNGGFQSPFQNPFQSQLGAYSLNPLLAAGVHQGGLHPAQQGIQILGQLAQHLLTHGAITQQTGFAIQQLAQQLVQLVQQVTSMQSAAGQQSLGSGPFGQNFGQSFGQGVPFGTQAQGWAANRPPTIQ